ncbi:MAG: hypothetical protein HY741_27945 [Chloroflexi bacterium]|nr:hypothetical protein [Chloroflexota bacterium]
MRLRIVVLFFVLAVGFVLAPRAAAQSPIVVVSQSLDMRFPRSMRFNIETKSNTRITVLRLTVWQNGVAVGARYSPAFAPSQHVRAGYNWSFQSLSEGGYLPPGTRGEYTWHIEDDAGNVHDTPRAAYAVEDRLHTWQTLSNDVVRVSWYEGDAAFGAAIFARALSAREFLAKQLNIQDIRPLQIFVYASKQDFFTALPPFSAEWTGGRMFPEYGVIMINFAPENSDWGMRATSHELSHAILHSKIRGTLGDLSVPHWLDEGLAVYNETSDHAPDDQFERMFQLAVLRNTLIPLRKLEQRFPADSEQAQLSYGESYSVVKFMIEKYGAEKFAALLNIYEKGAAPDDGLRQVYGMNQDELENAWRDEIGARSREISTARLPTLAPRPTFEVSSPLASPTVLPTASPAPTAEPTRIAQAANPAPDTAVPAPAPALPASGLCGGVVMLSGLVALSALKRRGGRDSER